MSTQRGPGGQFSSLYGTTTLRLRPEFPYPPGGPRYERLVFDANDQLIVPLNEWYYLMKGTGAARTRDTYLAVLQPWFGFLGKHGYHWNTGPEAVPALRTARVEGWFVQATNRSPISANGLHLLIAALRSFYTVMVGGVFDPEDQRYHPLYAFDNPMYSQVLVAWRAEHRKWIRNAGAPDYAGIRSESRGDSAHQPVGFFQVRVQPMEPPVARDSESTRLAILAGVRYMIDHAPTREAVILRIMLESGARVSEVLALTARGPRMAHNPKIGIDVAAFVRNKGDHTLAKPIWCSADTREQLHRYIARDRSQLDPHRRTRLEQLGDDEPIFLSRRKRQLEYSGFGIVFKRLLRNAQRHFGSARQPPDAVRVVLPARSQSPHVTEWHVRRENYVVAAVDCERPPMRLIVKLEVPEERPNRRLDAMAAIAGLVRAQTSVQTFDVIAVDVSRREWPCEYLIVTRLPGVTWQTLYPRLDAPSRAIAPRQIGWSAAELHTLGFDSVGEIGPERHVAHGTAVVDALKGRALRRIRTPHYRDVMLEVLDTRAGLFAGVSAATLCHEDMNPNNLVFEVRDDQPVLSGILDFESAWASSGESDLARLELCWFTAGSPIREGYAEVGHVADGYAARRPLLQLLWCLEYADFHPSPEHQAVTNEVCADLGIGAIPFVTPNVDPSG